MSDVCLDNIPGIDNLNTPQLITLIDFLECNIDNLSLCTQAVKYCSTDTCIYNDDQLIAAHGWHVTKILGRGKDGLTFLGYRYNDCDQKIYTVKILSGYGIKYIDHSILFSQMYSRVEYKNNHIYDLTIDEKFMYYNSSIELLPVENNLEKILAEICAMNRWLIKHTGFVFWDFGFGSGKNYMLTTDGSVKWIDYGGAGMLRCPNFESVYARHENLPDILPTAAYSNKESLVIAISDFIMCQFLLHYEYWAEQNNTAADIWASAIQTKTAAASQMAVLLPGILKTKFAQNIYHEFHRRDWKDSRTWKQLTKYINTNHS